MKVISRFYDSRIDSWNLYIESTFGEYLSFADYIIDNNDLQRKRVRTSKTVYSLLKNDLQKGCLMPSLVLAVGSELEYEPEMITGDELLNYIKTNPSNILILDGLQRTYTLIDAAKEIETYSEVYYKFCDFPLRMEMYLKINKFGVLYRMLTLNTGQTPMSTRHQLEMLYGDLLATKIDGMELISDTDGKADPDDNQFVFQYAIEGFNAYMNRSSLPINRQDLLENIKMLEKMAEEDTQSDLFRVFLECYIKVFKSLRVITNDYQITDDDINEYEISGSPFGRKTSKIFSTSQALTGFGAAAGKLKDFKLINSFDDISDMLDELRTKNCGTDWELELLKMMDNIRNTSKKIGNAQREFFQFFFRELFNREGDSYLDLASAVENGYHKYITQVS